MMASAAYPRGSEITTIARVAVRGEPIICSVLKVCDGRVGPDYLEVHAVAQDSSSRFQPFRFLLSLCAACGDVCASTANRRHDAQLFGDFLKGANLEEP